MRRAAWLVALAVVAGVALAAPAGAIQTTEFGIAPAAGNDLEVEVRAGRASSVPVRLWNLSDRTLDLRLELSPATVDPDGSASLEGDPAPVEWAELETRRLLLEPGRDRIVEIRFRGPSPLAAGEHTMAVIAQASPTGAGRTASVVQRLAPIIYVHAIDSVAPPSDGLGLAPWAAGLLAAAAAVATSVRARQARRRRGADAEPPALTGSTTS